jgi:hypothetical protein
MLIECCPNARLRRALLRVASGRMLGLSSFNQLQSPARDEQPPRFCQCLLQEQAFQFRNSTPAEPTAHSFRQRARSGHKYLRS